MASIKKAFLPLMCAVFMTSNAYTAELSLSGFSAEKLNKLCSADADQVEFIICVTYIGGWLHGVISQGFHVSISRLQTGVKSPFPSWAKGAAYQCLDPKISEGKLGKKFVAWYGSKLTAMREGDVSSFKKIEAGQSIANMMRDVYFCRVGQK